MPKNKYRIVTDNYAGFEAQVRFWWLPIWWFQMGFINTHGTLERAEEYIKNRKRIVKYVEV